jgi:hypothetical protein
LLEDEETGRKLDFDGKMYGKGLELQFAPTDLNALVHRIGFGITITKISG